MPWDQQTDHSLANMYQRLPGHALAAINPLKPCNFAALEIPAWAPKEAIAYSVATSNRGDVFSTWKTYTLPNEAKLKHALAAIERANSSMKRARKFQLNFTNGAHMVLSRDDPDDKTTLVFHSVYNPNTVYEAATARSVSRNRGPNKEKLKVLADERGHLIKRRADSQSSFSPAKLFNHAPNTSVSRTGFAFTPVSGISHQVKPNEIIAGVRPGLRETSPQAALYRPRPVSAAFLNKATLSQQRGATPFTSVYPNETLDHRFRKAATGTPGGQMPSIPRQQYAQSARTPRSQPGQQNQQQQQNSPSAAAEYH